MLIFSLLSLSIKSNMKKVLISWQWCALVWMYNLEFNCSSKSLLSSAKLFVFSLPFFTYFSIRAVPKVFKGKTITQLDFLYMVVYALKNWLKHKNENHKCLLLKGVIQQLRGPSFTQFWPLTPLEWTKTDILHTSYPLSNDPPPPSSCPRSYWMLPKMYFLNFS